MNHPYTNITYSRQQSVIQMDINSCSHTSPAPLQLIRWAQRPKFATSYWEEENTFCYQIDANSICVARRQDNDMINGTKLLNVTGMSRGKRDGILKNEKSRVVVKAGPMHLKGVWIPFNRAKELTHQFKIMELLHPLFLNDPSSYFRNSQYTTSSPSTSHTHQTTEIYHPKFLTVQSQSKPEYFPTDTRHHVYPSYDNHQRLQQQQQQQRLQRFIASPVTPSQPEFQSTDSYYSPPLLSYPSTPTDPSFSFDINISPLPFRQQHFYNLYPF